jgi:hypothetical protein
MKTLHRRFGDEVQFLDIVVRQAHPGPEAPAYRSAEEKERDARAFQRTYQIPWPVLVDDVDGRVHQAYGSLPDPTYIIDAEGRVAFYNLWTGVPTLHRALERLIAQGGVGPIRHPLHIRPHPLATVAAGWPALIRGGWQSVVDLMRAAPGLPVILWAGYRLEPVLAPVALRARPLPSWVRLSLGMLAGAAVAGGIFGALRRR